MSEPPRLDYQSARDDRAGARLVIQALAGCVLTTALVVATVIGCLVMMAARSTEYDPVSWLLALVIGGGVLVGLIVLSIWVLRRPARRGWAIGIWIGLGCGLLMVGLCFGMM